MDSVSSTTPTNGRVTLAVLDTKLDQLIIECNRANRHIELSDTKNGERMDRFEVRLRVVEISTAKLTVLVGGSAGVGGIVGVVIANLVGMIG